jgi:hypothetical protein
MGRFLLIQDLQSYSPERKFKVYALTLGEIPTWLYFPGIVLHWQVSRVHTSLEWILEVQVLQIQILISITPHWVMKICLVIIHLAVNYSFEICPLLQGPFPFETYCSLAM